MMTMTRARLGVVFGGFLFALALGGCTGTPATVTTPAAAANDAAPDRDAANFGPRVGMLF
jgi:hypothetical protein